MNVSWNLFTDAINYLWPEVFMTLAIMACALWNLLVPKNKEFTPFWGLAGVIAAMAAIAAHPVPANGPVILFNGLFTYDELTRAFSLIVLLVGLIVILMTMGFEHHLGRNRGEFYAILLTAVMAVMLLAGSTDLIMLFVALETLSVCCVILAGFSKRDVKSGEASLKYLLSTAATTATLMYGLSFAYGLSGSTLFSAIADKMAMLSLPPASLVKILILVLIISVIGFKLSTVPFHMWTPDVYEGAPTPVTAFLSIGSKAGGFVVALRLLETVFGKTSADWTLLVSLLAIASMVMGNLIALAQSSFKRMLAYSSIAHVGYILIGIVAASESALSSVIFYITVYGFMNLGAFAGAILIANETGSDRIDDMAGLMRKRPLLTLGMSVCLLNLAGLPIPPAGFFAKLFIFGSAVQIPWTILGMNAGWLLVGIGLATSIPAIYYYTRVVIKMIVAEPSDLVKAMPAKRPFFESPQGATIIALILCCALLLVAGTVGVDPVMRFSKTAVAPVVPVVGPISTLPQHGIE